MKPSRSDFGVFTPLSSPTIPPRSSDAEISMGSISGDGQLADAVAVSAKVRSTIRVLVIDDDRTLREGCASLLQVEGYNVTLSGRGDEAIDLLRRSRFDIILVDLCMTPVSGMEILKAALDVNPDTLVIMMTGNPSVATSVEALRMGAWDYLPKPFSGTHVQLLFGRAAHAVLARRDEEAARDTMLEQSGNSDKITMLGASPAFRKAVELARKVASTDASVMIVGESGT